MGKFPFSRSSSLFFLVACLAFGSGLVHARAQSFDLDGGRIPLVQIDSAWRFHLGDDPRWSQPSLDDSAWLTIKPTEDWTTQGVPLKNQFVWFRFHLRVPAHTSSLVLELPSIAKSYQLFADGQLIAQVGTLPPGPAHNVIGAARLFTVPIHSGVEPKDVAFALRTWQDPAIYGTRPSKVAGNVFIGTADVVADHFSNSRASDLLSDGAIYSLNLVIVVVGASAGILFLLTRERFYLWFALALLTNAAFQPIDYAAPHQAWDFYLFTYVEVLLDILSSATFSLFIVDALFPGKWRLALAPITAICIAEMGIVLVLTHTVSTTIGDVTYCVGIGSMQLILVWYLIRSWNRNIYARLLAFPVALGALSGLLNNFGYVLLNFDIAFGRKIIPSTMILLQHPFVIEADEVVRVVTLLAYLAALISRFALTSREKQRLSAALQAARDIQQRLVPVHIPSTTGLHVEIAYRAAEEVGGDFCQVLPRPDGSTLIAIGDVSGKGLQAAMLGAVAVGAIRSLADEQVPPARVLERLNQAMIQSESTVFTTCLCLVVTSEGTLIAANAGHLAPYLDGKELPLQANLPLGLLPGAVYEQNTFNLPDKARLMLLSDGVVEARSDSGELFGFDRTCSISTLGAQDIAAQAYRFGQQDDITVITVDWQGVVALEPA